MVVWRGTSLSKRKLAGESRQLLTWRLRGDSGIAHASLPESNTELRDYRTMLCDTRITTLTSYAYTSLSGADQKHAGKRLPRAMQNLFLSRDTNRTSGIPTFAV